MKLGMKLIMCWTFAVAFGGAAAGSMAAAQGSDLSYQQVAATN